MAPTRAPNLRALANLSICRQCSRRVIPSHQRWSSTSTQAPASPLLSKIKNDLKAAMRAKDTAKLTVLRGTISEINQAASSSSPIKTDMQVLALLRKRKSATENAKKEAADAKRPDIAEKQDKEMAIIDELTGSVKMIGMDELRNLVKQKIETLRNSGGDLKQGVVMKELVKPGGELDGKPYEGKVLAELVKEELSKS